MTEPFGVSVFLTDGGAADEATAWRLVLPSELRAAHPDRVLGWLTSRVALARAFALVGVRLDPAAASFFGHQQIVGLNQWRFSISHTLGAALVWLGPAEACLGLGVDLELGDWLIEDRVMQRIYYPSDPILTAVELWSAKEAAFKAVPQAEQGELTVSKISLTEKTFSVQGSRLEGQWKQRTSNGYVSSFAWVTDSPRS